jgi:hypothetical protein
VVVGALALPAVAGFVLPAGKPQPRVQPVQMSAVAQPQAKAEADAKASETPLLLRAARGEVSHLQLHACPCNLFMCAMASVLYPPRAPLPACRACLGIVAVRPSESHD